MGLTLLVPELVTKKSLELQQKRMKAVSLWWKKRADDWIGRREGSGHCRGHRGCKIRTCHSPPLRSVRCLLPAVGLLYAYLLTLSAAYKGEATLEHCGSTLRKAARPTRWTKRLYPRKDSLVTLAGCTRLPNRRHTLLETAVGSPLPVIIACRAACGTRSVGMLADGD